MYHQNGNIGGGYHARPPQGGYPAPQRGPSFNGPPALVTAERTNYFFHGHYAGSETKMHGAVGARSDDRGRYHRDPRADIPPHLRPGGPIYAEPYGMHRR